MGDVAITYSIMPESPSVNLRDLKDSIKNVLPKEAQIRGMTEKPVAFGLNALHVLIVVKDTAGIADTVESILSKLKGVQSVDVVEIGLI